MLQTFWARSFKPPREESKPNLTASDFETLNRQNILTVPG